MTKPLIWFWAASGAGIMWNAFGLWQFAGTLNATPDSLVGMTPEQAKVMTSDPVWMTIAFAIGVLGGLVGSALLILRRGLAVPILGTSLVGYVVLFVGDITQGIFAVMGAPQVIVLTVVVAIAVGLLTLARHAKKPLLLA